MKLLNDYDCTIQYYSNKENIGFDVLSRKLLGSLAHIEKVKRPLIRDLHGLMDEGFKLTSV